MTVPTELVDALGRQPLMAIIRLGSPESALEAADRLATAGVQVIEFSLAAPGGLIAIKAARDLLTERDVLVGAGTVRTEGDAAAALDAGAQFLVSPGVSPAVSEHARRVDVPYVPGAMTPTEVQTALDGGSPLVKLFPAATLGSAYVKDLLGPFPDVRLLATGGISSANAGDFMAAGAAAVAVGGALVNERNMQGAGGVAAAVAELLAAVDRSRGEPVAD
jgi:2-dehydro-3-deoxyphosphogluconate aldolase / (4S)-4-hydroxy-2-oxoglutarate aldolase